MQTLFIQEMLQLFFRNCNRNPSVFISNFKDSTSIIAFNFRCKEKRFTHVSASFKTILGYNIQNILKNGNFTSKIVHPQDKDAISECLTSTPQVQMMESERPDFYHFSQIKCRAKHIKGYWKYFIAYAQSYWNEGNSCADKIGLIVDQRIKSESKGSLSKVASGEDPEKGDEKVSNGLSSGTDFISPRENEILEMISNGLLTKEIASKLNISDSTVISHRKNLISKLHVRNTAELIKQAARHMLI